MNVLLYLLLRRCCMDRLITTIHTNLRGDKIKIRVEPITGTIKIIIHIIPIIGTTPIFLGGMTLEITLNLPFLHINNPSNKIKALQPILTNLLIGDL